MWQIRSMRVVPPQPPVPCGGRPLFSRTSRFAVGIAMGGRGISKRLRWLGDRCAGVLPRSKPLSPAASRPVVRSNLLQSAIHDRTLQTSDAYIWREIRDVSQYRTALRALGLQAAGTLGSAYALDRSTVLASSGRSAAAPNASLVLSLRRFEV